MAKDKLQTLPIGVINNHGELRAYPTTHATCWRLESPLVSKSSLGHPCAKSSVPKSPSLSAVSAQSLRCLANISDIFAVRSYEDGLEMSLRCCRDHLDTN